MPRATNTKGLTICLTKGAAAPVALTPTAISKANPAVVTAEPGSVVAGDLAAPVGTGFTELDGKVFVVGNITATGFSLLGSNTVGSSGALGTSPRIDINGDANLVCQCFSEFTIARDAPDAIEAGTFCDPTLTVASAVAPAGTFEFTGNVDVTDPGLAELYAAEEDGLQREIRITFPQGNGYVVAPVTITLVSWAFALDTSVQFTGAGTFNSKPRHAYDPAGITATLAAMAAMAPAPAAAPAPA